MKLKIWQVVVLVISSGVIFSFACISSTPAPAPTIDPVKLALETLKAATQAAPTEILSPPVEPSPVQPTALLSTSTPLATDTPLPTDTPVSPVVIPYQGNGDSVIDIDIDKIGKKGVLKIEGNSDSRFFGVTGLDASGNSSDLFVMSTEPYSGIRPINFLSTEKVTRLEIKAVGKWTISLMSLSPELLRSVNVPGNISGKGDEVILLNRGVPDLATITGNQAGRFFGVTAFTNGDLFPVDLLVMTTDPYNGTVTLPAETYALAIQATGDWSIDITSK